MTDSLTRPSPPARRRVVGQPELVALAVLVVLLSGRWIAPLLDVPTLQTWSTIFVAIVIQSVPFLVAGVVLSAFISILLSERVLQRIVPKNPAVGVPVAGVAGLGLPGCECAAVPIAGSLMRRGIAPAVALTFLLAAPAINPVVLVSTAVAFPDNHWMVVARFIASLSTAVLVGWWVLSRTGKLLIRNRAPDLDESMGKRQRFVATVRHDFLHASGFLVLGGMIAAAVNSFIPPSVLDTLAGQALVGIATMAFFAFIVALCSETDAFVAASFTAFSDTAKLVFLVVGPAMDIKLASMEAGYFGLPFARQFVPVVIGTAMVVASLVGWWLL